MYWLTLTKGPCSSTGQPAVLCLAEGGGILTGHHLAVYIRLGAVDLADVLNIGRAGLAVDLKARSPRPRTVSAMDDPGIVVAEDTGVLLVSRWIAGDLTKIQVILV